MPTKLPVIQSRDAVRALEEIGFSVMKGRGKGSHIVLKRESDRRILTVPHHKPIKPGTLRQIIRCGDLSVEQFIQLL